MSGPLLLLDAASLYYRVFFGVPDRRSSPDAPPNNAVRGFLDMIATLCAAHRPSGLVACWDDDWRPAFRVEAIPTYKSHRLADGSAVAEDSPPDLDVQVPVIVEALAALGIARVGCPGYEADDVIGSYAARERGRRPVRIVTGDRDLFQLVDDAADIHVLYTARTGVRDAELIDQAYLREAYGVATGEAYVDFAVLRGDPSDGLPGVPGIGAKTATQLLATYGDLAGLRAAVDGGDPAIKGARRAKLEASAAYLDAAPRVVRVAPDAPLPDLDVAPPTQVADVSAMSRLAVQYGLAASFDRVVDALGLAPR
ncbi:5'-3' exonuclease [Agilicoccus flavus]|uniref:5'-3' exonuclease n=1 Tax=Agilicoccus flavus TaxID=2775968 RepID=UPI001CF62644|nr:5'-3' exonuclease [Agilicoccus flavus]